MLISEGEPCSVLVIRLYSHILTTFITLTHTRITKEQQWQVPPTLRQTANINIENKYYSMLEVESMMNPTCTDYHQQPPIQGQVLSIHLSHLPSP